MKLCKSPKEGWQCTRGEGHEGPCALVMIKMAPKWKIALRILAFAILGLLALGTVVAVAAAVLSFLWHVATAWWNMTAQAFTNRRYEFWILSTAFGLLLWWQSNRTEREIKKLREKLESIEEWWANG